MKAKVYVVVKTNGIGEILLVKLCSTYKKAQEVVKEDYEALMRYAEEEGKGVSGCACCDDYAWLELEREVNYEWNIFERDLPEELS